MYVPSKEGTALFSSVLTFTLKMNSQSERTYKNAWMRALGLVMWSWYKIYVDDRWQDFWLKFTIEFYRIYWLEICKELLIICRDN